MKHAILISLSFILASCSTIVNGRYDEVRVSSSVPGAAVIVDGMNKGQTPCVVEVSRKGGQTLSIEKEGYEAYQTRLSTSLSGWMFGNILIGGLIGIAVDVTTGAWSDIEPDEINAVLTPKTPVKP